MSAVEGGWERCKAPESNSASASLKWYLFHQAAGEIEKCLVLSPL